MNNIKLKINEANQTVNEVQLKDLYLAATKGLQTLLNINTMAMNFTNPGIKRKAQALNSLAFELVTEIQKVMDNSGEQFSTSGMLDQDKSQEKVLESEINDGSNTMSMNESVIVSILKTLNLSKKEAKKILESYKFESEDMTSEEGNSLEEALENEESLTEGELDLTEAYSMVEDGQLDENDFGEFQNKIVEACEEHEDLKESIINMKSNQLNEMIKKVYDYADKNSIIVKN